MWRDVKNIFPSIITIKQALNGENTRAQECEYCDAFLLLISRTFNTFTLHYIAIDKDL